jgi:sphinganine-1-phosphate aldolase
LDLYNGDKECCGLTTTGGTESIIMAILCYREWAKKEKGITRPNLVCSATAHAAFDKGCHYMGVEIRKVPITKDLKCDVKGYRRMIDSNTIAVVASCPDYGFGNFDPCEDIGKLALSRGIGFHIDACLGSFVNPFIDPLGFKKN